ncbi:hypothetical protein P3X46_033318 [Hevea brasiliensis]|uniref:Glycine-rich protein n=1 Tax=Hevea brasiliensis TaxID=3981 RepID=A0ABQ9KJ89_HEVBR|nr:glycine-rich cell wall structural protein 2 [Hevea brasiliensis]KAJ9136219.1 hypothetical protein P3X46_033318 [Hevea brasiliensis]
MKTFTCFFILATLLLSESLSTATRPEPNSSNGKPTNARNKADGSGNDAGIGGFFGPGSGFGIPGLGKGRGNEIMGGGYGAGFGGPNGGFSKGGIIRPTVVCKERGPCYKKKLTCPAKCFTTYSRSGKGYGAGGGSGSCTMDCKKKCIAYC